jgi:hypothetical protein
MPTNHRAEDFVHHRIPTPAPEWQHDAAGGTSIPHFRFELIEPRSSPPPRRKRAPIRSAWNLRAVALRELLGLAPSARSGLRMVKRTPGPRSGRATPSRSLPLSSTPPPARRPCGSGSPAPASCVGSRRRRRPSVPRRPGRPALRRTAGTSTRRSSAGRKRPCRTNVPATSTAIRSMW